MDEAAKRLSRYFLAQLGINVGVGIVISIRLTIIGVPGLLFGVVTALLRLVPYVGTWIAALVAVVFAAAVGPATACRGRGTQRAGQRSRADRAARAGHIARGLAGAGQRVKMRANSSPAGVSDCRRTDRSAWCQK